MFYIKTLKFETFPPWQPGEDDGPSDVRAAEREAHRAEGRRPPPRLPPRRGGPRHLRGRLRRPQRQRQGKRAEAWIYF